MTDSTDSGVPLKSSGFRRNHPSTREPALIATATKALTIQEQPYLQTGRRTENSRPILRPAIGVRLLDRAGEVVATTRALVDSGADYITFSTDWAERLGIDIHTDCAVAMASVADGRISKRYVYTDGLEIEVAGERMLLPVVMFCENLPIALLGRHDFFVRYVVLVDQVNHRFFLERRPDLEDDPHPGLTDAADLHAALVVD